MYNGYRPLILLALVVVLTTLLLPVVGTVDHSTLSPVVRLVAIPVVVVLFAFGGFFALGHILMMLERPSLSSTKREPPANSKPTTNRTSGLVAAVKSTPGTPEESEPGSDSR